MPELPEVQSIINDLEKVLKGKTIKTIECYYSGTVITNCLPEDNPFPIRALAIKRRGKYIIIMLEKDIALIIHLRMTGKLIYDNFCGEPLKYERARIILENNEVLHFIDIRTFGKIVICSQKNIEHCLPPLGLEPFSDDFTAKALKEKMHGKKTPVKIALMDQKIIAGLGNIYVCEILYRAGINPEKPANKITRKNIVEIIQQTKEVLTEAIDKGGTSISDYRRIDDKPGRFQNFLQVYQKQFCPLGHKVLRLKQGGRSTFYCPICQK
ncbi:MAG TPA: bifunctional DNA-formamidopyrimidine glycosylase/DNA-(apurinic or apyrimidinic site) lyase [Candidatus Cloacimonas sp.]|nr:bifunctional DNA-formamidopyrimidine glycosylase/DNA-(apurinic or apyrimidinic site) lyase [Candidatus Cloacimonas sp.]